MVAVPDKAFIPNRKNGNLRQRLQGLAVVSFRLKAPFGRALRRRAAAGSPGPLARYCGTIDWTRAAGEPALALLDHRRLSRLPIRDRWFCTRVSTPNTLATASPWSLRSTGANRSAWRRPWPVPARPPSGCSRGGPARADLVGCTQAGARLTPARPSAPDPLQTPVVRALSSRNEP